MLNGVCTTHIVAAGEDAAGERVVPPGLVHGGA
jgi:hypothetical protein